MTASIRGLIAARWPHRFDPGELGDNVSLGEDGLGLDSVEIVEVITACEEYCGRLATEELFAVVPLTIERMADYFLS
jgi:acyl carrier protein